MRGISGATGKYNYYRYFSARRNVHLFFSRTMMCFVEINVQKNRAVFAALLVDHNEKL